jgi:hypothetical protein
MKAIYDYRLQLVFGTFVILTAVSAYAIFIPQHKTVTIDSKHWICSASDTVGIEARCTAYQYVRGAVDINLK